MQRFGDALKQAVLCFSAFFAERINKMDFEKLLRDFECECGKKHSCAIKRVEIGDGAIEKIPELVKDYKSIVIAADQNTYAACGEAVKSKIADKCEKLHIFECEGFLVPNEQSIEALTASVSDKTDLIVGIGSGVIQDLCKYVSFNTNLPYHIVATAPSMDGYASVGAAMITGNMKVTYNAHVPEAIVGDTEILKDAPMDLIKSGYGDILGKFSCLNDWKLSHIVNDEYICDYVYNLTFDMLNKTKDLGGRLLKRDKEAIKTLMEALVGVGIAMAYVGNSRPASGSEHHLSHFFEITGLLENKPYFLHGIDVVYSAVYTEQIREELLKLDEPTVGKKMCREEYCEKIKSVYHEAGEGVIALQDKLGWYNESKIDAYKSKWNEIKEVLAEVPSSEELKGYLKTIELDTSEFEKQYGAEKLQNAIWFAKDLKDRYTVLWMYFEICYGK